MSHTLYGQKYWATYISNLQELLSHKAAALVQLLMPEEELQLLSIGDFYLLHTSELGDLAL